MKISKYFTLEEATFSETAARCGILNEPTPEILKNMKYAAQKLDQLRETIAYPIFVSSWYRGPELNAKIPGSSSTSAHMFGYAIDCRVAQITPLELCKVAAEICMNYDQIIHEYGRWMHISFDPKNRRQNLTIFKGAGYRQGLLTEEQYRQLD